MAPVLEAVYVLLQAPKVPGSDVRSGSPVLTPPHALGLAPLPPAIAWSRRMFQEAEISLDGETGRLVGEIDVAVGERTEADLLAVALSAPSDTFVVDCAELTFIDMSGVHVLERVASRSGRQVHLVNLRRSCRIVFDTLELCELFGIEPSVHQPVVGL